MTDTISQESHHLDDLENKGNNAAKNCQFAHLEGCETVGSLDAEFLATFPEAGRKKILRKLDIRLLPLLCSLYILSFIDRSNIGNAKIEGMLKSIHTSEDQYSIALSVFFVTYILFEVPSNVVLERFFKQRPSYWIGGLTFFWGVMMTLHGVVQSFGGLMAVRLIMGAFEAGFFPAAVVLMSQWYVKFELSSRLGIFYAGGALAGACSGLLAYALAKMDGLAGVAGWRWIFIMEGIATVAIGITVPLLLIDTPKHTYKWLTPDEHRYIELRMDAQDGARAVRSDSTHFSWKNLWNVATDWQFYVFAFVFWSQNIPGYGLKFTMPTIMTSMGYTSNNAQLMTIPPYTAGAISAWCFGRLSDKFKRRAYFLVIPQICLVTAFAILTAMAGRIRENIGACYFAIVLACIGEYPITPGASAWISNNLVGPKRAIGLAFIFSLNNCGGIGSSYIYIASEAPSYPTGFGTSLAFAVAGIIAVGVLELVYGRINRKRDAAAENEVHNRHTAEELDALGDRSPFFRYTV